MCRAFSCIVTRRKRVVWKAGVDGHDVLIALGKLKDNVSDPDKMGFARVEIVPDHGEPYVYLWPEKAWTHKIDEQVAPTWYGDGHEKAAWAAFEEWKSIVYAGVNYMEARNPLNPLALPKRAPTAEDIALLRQYASVYDSVYGSVCDSVYDSVYGWVRDSVYDSVRDSVYDSVYDSVRDSVYDSVRDSVYDSVRDSVYDSVRDSVRDSVYDSVWAYIGSLFPGVKEWKYAPPTDGYPYQPWVDLWKRRLVPSYDGTVWRLHSGPQAEVVWEGKL